MLNINHSNINSPVRKIKGKVELYSSTEPITYTYRDALKSFSVERVGEGRFFGYGICQKVNVKLIDVNREISTKTSDYFKIYLTSEDEYIKPFPSFYITENHRDENTNELSITAYDKIYNLTSHLVGELGLEPPYTIRDVASAGASFLGGELVVINIDDGSFDLSFEEGANFEGTENIREVFNAIAEATQSIYYIDSNENLVFKRLDRDGAEALPITRADYITLDSKDNRRLQTIVSATELGDNVSASIDAIGTTHYIRNNPFWELREDIAEIVDRAIAAVGGFTINQFEMSWRGNYLLEPGDKIAITTKDDAVVYSFLLDEALEYTGYLSSSLRWAYEDNEAESANNPTSIGDTLKYTYARVDKANKQIELMVSDIDEMSSLQLSTSIILASVTEEVDNINTKVDATLTSEEINLAISKALSEGAEKVVTTTGFVFDDEGLTVSKTGSEMSTKVTEDGMKVYKDRKVMLSADNTGVKAEDLHATTFLIVGKNSRFEDFENNRTGCFWIGG